MADIGVAKAGTIVAAAMETAGAAIQSRMLEFVLGNDGMQIAGAFYLIAIITAIIVVAVGGSYKWGRYLLIGPSLFLFLVQIQTESDGTEWAFGSAEFTQEAVQKALVGVDVAEGGVGSVSLFYHFWNVFLSETIHRLIALLNLTQNDSQFNFIQKVERFMNARNFASINDPDLRLFVNLSLSNKCSRYFALQRAKYDLHIPELVRENYNTELNEWNNNTVYFSPEEIGSQFPGMDEWLKKNNIKGSYNCPRLWSAIVDMLRPQIEDTLKRDLDENNMPGQSQELTKENFLKQWASSISRRSGTLGANFSDNNAGFSDAVDWLVAKALWNEVWNRNPYIQGIELENNSGLHQSGLQYARGNPSGINERVASNIRQFEITNTYSERSRFTMAALSMPYFQGVALCLLSALYPFFALMVVVPGKAKSIFIWMALWAWIKLWDLGFAVVMLIDNMLYAMFPRGLSVTKEEMNEPGLAWQKVLEIDPNYSLSTYYTMISMCIFAVPLVTGIFVKMGGNELVNLMNQSWSDYSSRIAGATASFARSMQAQGYMKNLQQTSDSQVRKALEGAKVEMMPLKQKMFGYSKLRGALESLNHGSSGPVLSTAISYLRSEEQAIMNQIEARYDEVAATEKFAVEVGDVGFGASENAVAARYYQHDLKQDHPGMKQFRRDLAESYRNVKSPVGAAIDGVVKDFAGGKN